MTDSTVLHSKLSRLRRRRSIERRLAAMARVLTVVCWALLLTCGLDLLFHLNQSQRLFVMALAGAGIAVRLVRSVPRLAERESLTHLALYVERQAGLDSDLIAALQLDNQSRHGGSRALARQAVSRGQQMAATIDWPIGFAVQRTVRTGIASVVSLLTVLALALAYPSHASAFVSRLALRDAEYPTATVIQEVRVNRRVVLGQAQFPPQPADSRAVAGGPLEFRVVCSGSLPEKGTVVVRSDGRQQIIELSRLETVEGDATYQGLMSRFLSGATYTIHLGDAATRSSRIELVRHPVVDLRLLVRPPSYAQHRLGERLEAGVENVRLLEGSDVDLLIHSSKALHSVRATIQRADGEATSKTHELTRMADEKTWRLDSKGSRLQHLSGPLKLSIQVRDVDDLDLARPLEVRLGLMADRVPEGRASADHRVFVATARPLIQFEARDDYGIRAVIARVVVQRKPKSNADAEVAAVPEKYQQELFRGRDGDYKTSLSRSQPLQLSSWNLNKDDRVQITLEIVDDRGQNPGKTYRCDPIELRISDELGVYEANAQFDDATNRSLNKLEAEQLRVLTGGDK